MIFVTSFFAAAVLFTYGVYGIICFKVVVASRKVTKQQKSRLSGRAAKYVFILLLLFTISWLPFVILLVYDFKIHNSDFTIKALRKHNCYEHDPMVDFELDESILR
jgi:hypothetical protein